MALLSPADVLAFLMADDELPGALRWADHHGLKRQWTEETLTLTLLMSSAGSEDVTPEEYLLEGVFIDYRVMPPAWRFLDPRTGLDIGRPSFPAPGPFPGGSILHSNAVICAPWNRLAYQDKGGPHNDWTDASQWQSTATEHTHASTVPEMLARVHAEVKVSPHRMASLPEMPPAGENSQS